MAKSPDGQEETGHGIANVEACVRPLHRGAAEIVGEGCGRGDLRLQEGVQPLGGPGAKLFHRVPEANRTILVAPIH